MTRTAAAHEQSRRRIPSVSSYALIKGKIGEMTNRFSTYA